MIDMPPITPGKLAPGFGARGSTIGPELGFGHVVGDAFDEPVLLIKTAWGGKSLQKDFRPAEESPSNQGYHWNGNAETYYLIGEAMGEAMKELCAASEPREPGPAPMREFRSADGSKTFKGRLQGYDTATKIVTVRREDGRMIRFDLHHLLDPRTGIPANELSSVTVAAPSATMADALSTAVFVLGLQKGKALIQSLADTDALFVSKAGDVSKTSDFPFLI